MPLERVELAYYGRILAINDLMTWKNKSWKLSSEFLLLFLRREILDFLVFRVFVSFLSHSTTQFPFKTSLSQEVWPNGNIIFQSLAAYIIENLPSSIKIVKAGTKVCQIPYHNHTKFSQRLLKFCQSGKYSPNLVTLNLGNVVSLHTFIVSALLKIDLWVKHNKVS